MSKTLLQQALSLPPGKAKKEDCEEAIELAVALMHGRITDKQYAEVTGFSHGSDSLSHAGRMIRRAIVRGRLVLLENKE